MYTELLGPLPSDEGLLHAIRHVMQCEHDAVSGGLKNTHETCDMSEGLDVAVEVL